MPTIRGVSSGGAPASSATSFNRPGDPGEDASAPPSQLRLFAPLPKRPTLEVDLHAVSRPARAFTGDFYFTHRDDDRLWFALGDVAGKGLPAAVVMAMIQEELEHRISACALTRCDPAATMFRLHTFLQPLLPRNRFATAVIGHLRNDGKLVIANAGHCPPLIVRRSGTIEEVPSTGPAAGILPLARWCSVEMGLDRGETLLLFSDGLVEAKSHDGEEFGAFRIASAAEPTYAPRNARAIADAILEAVDRHADGAREDDLTLVVLKREPPSPR